MSLNASAFKIIAALIKQEAGISLSDDKDYLVESRLLPVARSHGMNDVNALADHIKSNASARELVAEITDAMTTNETSFFRDTKPFTHFREYTMPKILEATSSGKVRIWCAACSSGQEPYTLSMCLQEDNASLGGREVDMLATDISPSMVKKAQAGKYSQFEVQRGMPIQLLLKYFTQEGDDWQINQATRDMVTYKELNLLGDFGSLGSFDAVFCRNVLIYFEDDLKGQILDGIAALLKPHGVLYLGSSENVMGISDKYAAIAGQAGAFEKKS